MVNSNNWYSEFTSSGTVTQSGSNPDVQIRISTSTSSTSTVVNSLYRTERIQDSNAFTVTFQHKFTASGAQIGGNSVIIFFGSDTNNPLRDTVSNQICFEMSSYPSDGNIQGIHLWKNGTKIVNNVDTTWFATADTWQTYKISYKRGTTNTWTISNNDAVMYTYSDSEHSPWLTSSGSYWGFSSGSNIYSSYNNFIKAVKLTVSTPVSMAVIRNKIYEKPENCFVNKLSRSSQDKCAAAYSCRLVIAEHVGAMVKVRRGSDNAMSDFYGNIHGEMGTGLLGTGTSLTSWLGGAIGYVTKWYDQSGNERDILNANTTQQPIISQGNSGATITFDGTSDYLEASSNLPLSAGLDTFTFVSTTMPTTISGWRIVYTQGAEANGQQAGLIQFDNTYTYRGRGAGFDGQRGVTITANNLRKNVMMCNHNITDSILMNDNGTIFRTSVNNKASLTVGTARWRIGCDGDNAPGGFFQGQINELIVFRSVLTITESMLYYTPVALNTVKLPQQPKVRLYGIERDHNAVPLDYKLALDTTLLSGTTHNTTISNWGTASQSTAGNRPTYNQYVPGAVSRHPYVAFNSTSGNHMSVGTQSFAVSNGFTIVAYVRYRATTNWGRIIDFGNGASNNNIVIGRSGTSNNLFFSIYETTTQWSTNYQVTGANMITNGEWAVFAARYTVTADISLMEVIKNGRVMGTYDTGVYLLNKSNLVNTYIGRSNWSGDAFSDMDMGGLYIYERTLTDTELASVSNHLIHGTSSNIPNSIPNYANIQRKGHCINMLTQGPRGEIEPSMYFPSAVTNYYQLTEVPGFPMSVSFWFKTDISSTTQGVIGLNDLSRNDIADTGNCFDMQLDSSGKMLFWWKPGTNAVTYFPSSWNSGVTSACFSNTVSYVANTWYHVAITISVNYVIKLYINNSLINAVTFNNSLISEVTGNYPIKRSVWYVGSSADNSYGYQGFIHDFRLYDYILRADDVTSIYDENAGRDQPQLHSIIPSSNYLVNISNWSNKMTLTNHSGTFTAVAIGSEPMMYYQLNNRSACVNSISNQTRIQDNDSFTFAFQLFTSYNYQGGVNFFCGSTAIPTSTTGAQDGFMLNFQSSDTSSANEYAIHLIDNNGTRVATAKRSEWAYDSWIPIIISYKRGIVNTWIVNYKGEDIITYSNTNNVSWLTSSGVNWGIVGISSGTGLNSYIRCLELTSTPYAVSSSSLKELVPPDINSPMTANVTEFDSESNFRGLYIASASSIYDKTTDAYFAFDNDINTFWASNDTYDNLETGVLRGFYKGTVSTMAGGIIHRGEWLQIQIPLGVAITSYTITPHLTQYMNRSPHEFVVLGSMNGSTWDLVDERSVITYMSAAAKSFTLHSKSTYIYYRLVVKQVSNGAGWFVYLSVTDPTAPPVADTNRCQCSWSINSTNISNKKYIPSSYLNIQPYPPTRMTGNTTVISNTGYGAGSYVASASTTFSGAFAYTPFGNYTTNGWSSNAFYNTSTGVYAGAISTTAGGTAYSGEWLQLQMPQRIVLHSFEISPTQTVSSIQRSPRVFYVLGSNNGTTWTLVHSEANVNTWTLVTLKFIVKSNPDAYSYYRLIVNRVGNADTDIGGLGVFDINRWNLYSLTDSSIISRNISLLQGLTWKYYDGYYADSMTFFTSNTYRQIGRTNDLTTINTITNGRIPASTLDTFSIELVGYFRANITGTWKFYINSDDASHLWLGSKALAGYTTANALVNNGGIHPVQERSGTIVLIAGQFYPIRIMYGDNNGGDVFSVSFSPPSGALNPYGYDIPNSISNVRIYDGTGYFYSSNGQEMTFPAESAKVIKDLTLTNSDGVYYINCNGNSTPTYCLMNDIYDGGGWMMLMKATRGNTFSYNANYWTSTNILNPEQTNRNDGDAKFNTFNYMPVKDVLAIWPDVSSTAYTNMNGNNGGSFLVDDGWVWKVDNWNGATRTTGLAGFQNPRDAPTTFPSKWNGHSKAVWSSIIGSELRKLTDASSFSVYGWEGHHFGGCGGYSGNIGGIAYGGGANSAVVRWGMVFNGEANNTSVDVIGGIGLYFSGTRGTYNYSAGDINTFPAEAWTTDGLNRTMRVEMYGR